MKKIIIPTDYSENAKLASLYGIELASKFNAEVKLIHSYHIPVGDPNYAVNIDNTSEIEQLKINEEKSLLLNAFPNVRIEAKSHFGPIVDVLKKTCETEDIDLIVMGTKGQSNMLDGLIGTIASNVISEIKCDKLVIPHEASFKDISEIVLATDYHNIEQYNCFNNLIEILKATEASLAIVNIQKDLDLFEIPTRTENRIEDLFGNFKISKHFVQSDDVEGSLQHFAKSHKADLIALTAPHYSFWERIWHKSLTQKMTLHSDIPLLILNE